MVRDPSAMEPMLPDRDGDPGDLADLALALVAASAQAAGRLHPLTEATLRDLLRTINSYYSNLIEGHRTHPIDSVPSRSAATCPPLPPSSRAFSSASPRSMPRSAIAARPGSSPPRRALIGSPGYIPSGTATGASRGSSPTPTWPPAASKATGSGPRAAVLRASGPSISTSSPRPMPRAAAIWTAAVC